MGIAPLSAGMGLVTDADGHARFVIEQVVAQTAFGITYRARHTRLNASVAIKEFAPAYMCTRQVDGPLLVHQDVKPDFARMRARFVREGQTLHAIQHPHVAQVLDCWRDGESAYIATRWVEQGEPFDNRVASMFSMAQRMQLLLQLLDALHAVHSQRTLHNDVKPANVLVAQGRNVVLIDFGVARQETELQMETRNALFTWGWAAPEIMEPASLHQAGPWSDLYSWGLMALEVLIGLGAAGPIAPPHRVVSVDPYANAETRLRQVGVSTVWAQSIAACISVQRDRRPASAAELLRVLHSALPIGVTPLPQWTGGISAAAGLPTKPDSVVRVCDGCGTACPAAGRYCTGCGLELTSTPVLSDVSGRAATARRIVAALVDFGIVGLVTILSLNLMMNQAAQHRMPDKELNLVLLSLFIAWDVLYHVATGLVFRGSVGKLLVGLRVRTASFEEPSASLYFWRAIMRTLGIALFAYGPVWIWTNPRRRAIHDYATGTCVVRIQRAGGPS